MIGCSYDRKYYEFQPTLYDRGLLRSVEEKGTGTAQINGMVMDRKGTETVNINGMTVEYTDKYINIKNFNISIPREGLTVKITDADVLGFTDGVKKILQRRSNLARRVRMGSGTGQILAAAAGATLGLIAHANVETVAALAAVSAVIPELQTIWDARGRAETYNQGLNLIQKAEARYYEKKTAAGPLTKGISSQELTPEGVELLKEVTASIQVVGTALVELIPTVDELLAAHGKIKDELEQIRVVPEQLNLLYQGTQNVRVLYGKAIAYSIDGVDVVEITPKDFGQDTDSFSIKGVGSGTAKVTIFNSHGKSKSINVTVVREIPVADAGGDRIVKVGEDVGLDGSRSHNQILTYTWRLEMPEGSKAVLGNPDKVRSNFKADIAGVYWVELKVGNQKGESDPVRIKITTNKKPIANAGTDQNRTVGSTVELDGSGSKDPDGDYDMLRYKWEFSKKPETSKVTFATQTVKTTFVADQPGEYVVTLVVNDGKENSDSGSCKVTITVKENQKPTANAGEYQTVKVGNTVTLDGSKSSDPEKDPLVYIWNITDPAGGNQKIEKQKEPKTPFKLEKAGEYIVKLTVNDGHTDSEESNGVKIKVE